MLGLLEKKELSLFGLDIGTASVKIVRLDGNASDGFKPASVAIQPIQYSDNQNDQQQQRLNIVRAIKDCSQKANLKTDYAVCGVGGDAVAVRNFQFPVMPPEEVQNAVLFEAEQVCPFDIKQSMVDYQLLSVISENQDSTEQALDKYEGVLVAASTNILTEKTSLLSDASLHCTLIDAESLALINCFENCNINIGSDAVALLDIGHTFTNVIIFHETAPPFVRDINRGAKDVIEQVCRKTELNQQQVMKRCCKKWVDQSEQNQQQNQADIDAASFKKAFDDACENIVVDVNESLRFYSAQHGQKITRIYACGGFSLVEDMIDILKKRVAVEVNLWNPLKILLENGKKNVDINLIENSGPAFALAAGLAMRSV